MYLILTYNYKKVLEIQIHKELKDQINNFNLIIWKKIFIEDLIRKIWY
jgi:hypothetical protein